MRQFYIVCEKWQTVSAILSWSHFCELLPLENLDEIKYYVQIAEANNLSVRGLRNRIKSKEYDRLNNKTKEKLINKEDTLVSDFIKDPIIVNNSLNYIDKNKKRIGMSNTIGLIISKYKNEYIIEYSSDNRIKVTTYLIKENYE